MLFGLKKTDKKEETKDTTIASKEYIELNIPKEDNVKNTEFNPWDYIRVVNARGELEYQAHEDEKVIIAYRANPILGNKHPMKNKSLQERDRVIKAFEKDLEEDLAIQGPIWRVLQEIAKDIIDNKQKIALECWCMPCDCHASRYVPIIVKMLEEKLTISKNNANKPKI